MGLNIKIENKKSMFKKKKDLTRSIVLNILGEGYVLGYFQMPSYVFQVLDEEELEDRNLSIINYEKIGRGLSFYIDGDFINIDLLVPTTIDDIEQAEYIVKKLAKYVGSKTVIVEGAEVKTSENIISDHNRKFLLTSKYMFEKDEMVIPSAYSCVQVSVEDSKRFREASEDEFIEIFHKYIKGRNIDVYHFNMRLYHDEESEKAFNGLYLHGPDEICIIPKSETKIRESMGIKGFLNQGNTLNIFVRGVAYADDGNIEEVDVISYEEFIERIKPYITQDYDASSYIIRGLSDAEIREVYKK